MMRIKKIVIFILSILLIYTLPSAIGFADSNGDANSDGYYDNDFNKIRAFLNRPSAVAGKTNGQQLNVLYDPNYPATWLGISWDASSPKRVKTIACQNKSLLGDLDLSGLTSLTSVYCSDNSIISINTSGDIALATLHCEVNQIDTIDVSGNVELKEFACFKNKIGSLNIGDCFQLQRFECFENSIRALDVRANAELQSLDCSDNLLTTLDTSFNTKLITLECENNLLTSLDLRWNTGLETLNCSGNEFISLELTGLPKLNTLQCLNNPLATIHASFNDGTAIKLQSIGHGYIGVLRSEYDHDYYVQATPLDGYLFRNWSSSGSAVSTGARYDVTYGSSYDLRANFQYKVSFDSQLGSPVGSVVADINETIIAPASPSRTGYAFSGWYKEKACTSQWNFEADRVAGDMTLYAKWTANAYTVVFNSQSDSRIPSISANYNTLISAPAVPMRKGYVFGGWYKEAACISPWNFASDTVTGNITLYAKWASSRSVVVKANSNKYGSVSGGGIYGNGSCATVTAIPKNGYYFEKWMENSTIVSKDPTYTFTVAGNRTLKAYFCAIRTPSVTIRKSRYNKVSVSWKAIPYADGYEVYRSTFRRRGYQLIRTVEGAFNCTDTELLSGTTYFYQVRAYCKTGSTTTYGKYSSAKSVTPQWTIPILSVKLSNYNTASLSWNSVSEANGYEIWRSTSDGGFVLVGDVQGLCYSDVGLEAGVTYYYKVLPYEMVNGQKFTGTFSNIKSIKPKWPTIKAKAAAQSHCSILVSWNEISGAAGYELRCSNSAKGNFELVASDITSSSYLHDGLEAGKSYYYRVCAYTKVNGVKVYGPLNASSTSVKPTWPSITLNVSLQGYHSANLSWNSIPMADGYLLYRSTARTSGFEQVGIITGTSCTVQLEDAEKTYYFKVVPYDDANGKRLFGSYSRAKSVKAKWPTVKAKAVLQYDGSVLISWGAITGVQGYEILYSTAPEGPYILLAEGIADTSYVVLGLEYGTTYYFRVRPYEIVDGTIVYGKLSACIKVIP